MKNKVNDKSSLQSIEDTDDNEYLEAWEKCKNFLGIEKMLLELEKYLTNDDYHNFLKHLDNYYKLNLFENEEDYY